MNQTTCHICNKEITEDVVTACIDGLYCRECADKELTINKDIKISRAWAMPSFATFTIKPIKKLLEKYGVGKGWIGFNLHKNIFMIYFKYEHKDMPALQKYKDIAGFSCKSSNKNRTSSILQDMQDRNSA